MNEQNNKRNVVFLGTSLPRECGIATFTQDLIDQFAHIKDFNSPKVIAINNNGKSYAYDSQVIMQIDQQQRVRYAQVAEELNRSNADLLIIQHEFGIYGGESGEYLLDLVDRLNIPFMVVFHTVLSQPSPKQRFIMHRLGESSEKVITMAQNTVHNLIQIYDVPLEKIEVVHHGVPSVNTESRANLKEHYGFTDRKIISTFGFLSPGKGIEYGIEAIKGVVETHPEALYIIWGKTHPVVKEETGEVYRQQLKDLIHSLDLDNNVKFVDKLLTQEEVIQSLVMSDIYMTPYLGKDQAVSGTLAYGVGYGRVIVSTPYRYAEEMLADGRGYLAKFRDSASLQACILDLLDNPLKKKEMEARTLALGKTMMWSEIAKRYAMLVRGTLDAKYLSLRRSAI
ncbi:glycosyltransferase [Paenibacillus psychroresistens]|uniref:Glycosyltransferase n=1 Tax=Paenibacillus psychroresistens TaxID=1778678 RepID=A0A6B8RQI1_9BACL|nr:glycosyltransferase family 4 protein [Paenibacillus psychroresistens]QGQ98641.1 glycosyltransferase [Paenibacillus psychroresistens]